MHGNKFRKKSILIEKSFLKRVLKAGKSAKKSKAQLVSASRMTNDTWVQWVCVKLTSISCGQVSG